MILAQGCSLVENTPEPASVRVRTLPHGRRHVGGCLRGPHGIIKSTLQTCPVVEGIPAHLPNYHLLLQSVRAGAGNSPSVRWQIPEGTLQQRLLQGVSASHGVQSLGHRGHICREVAEPIESRLDMAYDCMGTVAETARPSRTVSFHSVC